MKMTRTFCDRCGEEIKSPFEANEARFIHGNFAVGIRCQMRDSDPSVAPQSADLCPQCISDVVLGKLITRAAKTVTV
jgi:hypothetical protein